MDDEQYFADFAENPPENFGKSLYEQLNTLENSDSIREEKISMNSYARPFPTHQLSALPANKRPRGRGLLLALVATFATVLLLGIFIINQTQPENDTNLFQPAPIDLDALQPITADNLDDMTLLATLGDGQVYDLKWSPDNTTVAIAGTRGIHLHDANDLNTVRLLTSPDMTITSIDYSSDGTIIAGTRENTIWFWSAATGEVLQTIETEGLQLNPHDLSNLEFSPDDTRLSVLGCIEEFIDDETQTEFCHHFALQIYNRASGELQQTIELETGIITQFTLAPDWSVFGYSLFGSNAITLMDVTTGEQLSIIHPEREQNSVRFAFTNDSQQIIVINSEYSDLREIFTIADLPTITEPLDFEPQRLISTSGSSQIAMHPNNEWYAVLDRGRTITFRYIEDGTVAPPPDITNRYYLSQILISPDGSRILGQSFEGSLAVSDISVESSLENRTFSTYYGYRGITNTPVFSQDDTSLFTTTYIGPATEWNLTTAPATRTFWGDDPDLLEVNNITSLQLHPTENHLYYLNNVPSTGSQFFYRNLDTNEIQPTGMTFGGYGNASWAITADNEIFHVNTFDGTLEYWSPETTRIETIDFRDIERTAPLQQSYATSVSPDGTLFIAEACRTASAVAMPVNECNEPFIIIWDTETRLPLARLELNLPSEPRPSLAISATSQSLLVQWCSEPTRISQNGSVYISCEGYERAVWDLTALEELNDVDTEDSRIDFDTIPLLPALDLDDIDCMSWSPPELFQINGEDFITYYCGQETQLLSFDPATNNTELIHSFNGIYNGVTLNHSETMIAIINNNTIELWGIPD